MMNKKYNIGGKKKIAALGIDPEMLINKQSRYNIQVARANKDNQHRWNEVRRISVSFPGQKPNKVAGGM